MEKTNRDVVRELPINKSIEDLTIGQWLDLQGDVLTRASTYSNIRYAYQGSIVLFLEDAIAALNKGTL
jgi:hypothetical protein